MGLSVALFFRANALKGLGSGGPQRLSASTAYAAPTQQGGCGTDPLLVEGESKSLTFDFRKQLIFGLSLECQKLGAHPRR